MARRDKDAARRSPLPIDDNAHRRETFYTLDLPLTGEARVAQTVTELSGRYYRPVMAGAD